MHPAALALNPSNLQLLGPEGWIDITDSECILLQAFASSTSQRLATAAMLEHVGKPIDRFGKRALEVQIVRLRKKLLQAGVTGPTIKAIRGQGYQLCVLLSIRVD